LEAGDADAETRDEEGTWDLQQPRPSGWTAAGGILHEEFHSPAFTLRKARHPRYPLSDGEGEIITLN